MARDLISDAATHQRETDEAKRRLSQVREHVPPPADVSVQELAGLSMQEKAAKMFPEMVEQVRRRVAAPLNPPPRNNLGWWRSGYRP